MRFGYQMPDAGCQKSGSIFSVLRFLSSGICLLTSVFCLLSCTAIHTPPVALPDRASLTPGETVIVNGNPNLYAFSRAHNVSLRDVIVLNNMQPPYVLKPGQQIVLPAGASNVGAAAGAATGSMPPLPSAAPSGSIEAVPLDNIQAAPVETAPLAPPQLTPKTEGSLSQGASVQKQGVLVAPASTAAKTTAVDALNAPVATKPVATTVAPQQAQQVAAATPPAPVTPPAPALSTAAEPTPIAMVWPVKGPILSSFGPKGQGLNNDGINIGAPKGAPVVAAAAGTVVYAGNEMKGFGNLVLIRHEGGWVTAYAHLDRMLVSKDAVVGQGDMIGTVGKTGNVPSPQLHFETRFEGKSVDPGGVIKS